MPKHEPLTCPQCGGRRATLGFARRKGSAWLSDGRIYCDDCRQVTQKSGKTKKYDPDWGKCPEGEEE